MSSHLITINTVKPFLLGLEEYPNVENPSFLKSHSVVTIHNKLSIEEQNKNRYF